MHADHVLWFERTSVQTSQSGRKIGRLATQEILPLKATCNAQIGPQPRVCSPDLQDVACFHKQGVMEGFYLIVQGDGRDCASERDCRRTREFCREWPISDFDTRLVRRVAYQTVRNGMRQGICRPGRWNAKVAVCVSWRALQGRLRSSFDNTDRHLRPIRSAVVYRSTREMDLGLTCRTRLHLSVR